MFKIALKLDVGFHLMWGRRKSANVYEHLCSLIIFPVALDEPPVQTWGLTPEKRDGRERGLEDKLL